MRPVSRLFAAIFTMILMTATAIRVLPNPARAVTPFDFSRVNKGMLGEFAKAWRISKNGTGDSEGVVLLYALPDGSYRVKALNSTNEFQSFTFTWEDSIVAIFHTHPRGVDPKPSEGDRIVADKYRVLMFTLTLRGMYVYDPQIKKTRVVLLNLDWLNASKWAEGLSTKMAALSPSFSSGLIASSPQ